ncbi:MULTISPECIES: magnesium/cobalt transporter CorA [Microbacterium]|jgi:magnesium transporter|uniref:Magnesium transport protein CorA n=1 Tax=Microbacterium maritypicum TaxID=33918 RepID=A0AAD3X2D5_MICMQ|nr:MULTISPECIES: magnesium/cobalt transporter CorA [Microbacterium]AZS48855.1 Cobalt/magnesium transport protein CorA [Microbacterium oxydans]KAB1885989.1 magnesium/cobalt transporter CorA [Microbacterium liquefaciens]KQV02617.1 transporter [Microbacterium sp. Root322]KQY78097.1 transporter [Microbacterium sp. Root1433D1]WKT90275.1 magnesium/cobalt transporter CorA [Microbacterium liquefaciens]
MAIIDNAIYVDGVRTENPVTLSETFERMRERDGMGWIGLYRPSEDEIREVAEEFGIHALVVEDALSGHQRAKLERYGDVLFMVLRPARYLDDLEEVEFGEVHVLVGPDFVVTIRHAESPDLGRVRRRLEADPALLAHGPEAVLYAILDEVVDEYTPVLAGLENDIDEIESQLFEENTDATQRIYDLGREVIDFQRATQPLSGMLEALLRGSDKYQVTEELQRYLRDVLDHTLRVSDRATTFRTVLDNALTVESTIVARRQNEEMRRMTELSIRQNDEVKKISGWAAILFAPTLVGTIYGMNFDHMPELHWLLGYPMAVGMMIALGFGLYAAFKRKGWL